MQFIDDKTCWVWVYSDVNIHNGQELQKSNTLVKDIKMGCI